MAKVVKDAKKKNLEMTAAEETKLRDTKTELVWIGRQNSARRSYRDVSSADRQSMDHLFQYGLLNGVEESAALETLRQLHGGLQGVSVFDLNSHNIYGVATWLHNSVCEVNRRYAAGFEEGTEPTLQVPETESSDERDVDIGDVDMITRFDSAATYV